MKVFIKVIQIRIQLLLQYRMAAIAGVFTQIFFGFFMIMIYEAFYENSTAQLPMPIEDLITYVWLGQALLSLLPWNGDREIQGMIKSGQVAYEFLRPINLYWYWYARMMAQRIASATLRLIPLIIFAAFLPEPYKINPPANLEQFFMFVITLTAAVFLGVAISNIITISVLFTIGDGVDRILPAIVMFFSGLIIPIPLFPNWSQWLFKILPFSALTDGPYRFYLGLYNIDDFLFSMVHVSVWTVITVSLGMMILNKASKRLVVQGG